MPSLNQLFTRTSQALGLIGRSRSRRSSRSRNEKIRRRVLLLEKFKDRALLTAGMLDPTFGVGGKVITDMLYPKPTNTAAGAVAIASDGKIVAEGGAVIRHFMSLGTTQTVVSTHRLASRGVSPSLVSTLWT